MTGTERFIQLLDRYTAGHQNPEEEAELFQLIRSGRYQSWLEGHIQDALQGEEAAGSVLTDDKAKLILDNIIRQKQPAKLVKMKSRRWVRWAVAASVVGGLGLGAYLVLSSEFRVSSKPFDSAQGKRKDVPAPDKNRAMITLADGRVIYLDSLDAGTIATQNGITVVKNEQGQLQYKNSKLGTENSELIFNTLTNPRGSKVIDMTLSDGSHVWLNAGSSITYPVAFISDQRKVAITGEAYFEISHDEAKPFIVSVNDKANVTVLGTYFNVNAYEDEEDIKVTLLEGSVRVSNPTSAVTIKPGQQAIGGGTRNTKLETRNSIDLESVMAWKNGLFNFNNADLQTVLRQLARWYDVTVVYESAIPKRNFGGEMQRDLSLAEVLKVLEKNNVHFRIEGKRLIVLP